MKKIYCLIVALAALSPVAMAATHTHVGGAICTKTGGDDWYLDSSGGFLYNGSSSAAWVGCAVPITGVNTSSPVSVNPSQWRVDYFDFNSTADSSGAVYCQFRMNLSTGTYVISNTRYSCSTAGGCDTAGDTFNLGVGYITWPDTIGATANVVGMAYVCQVPGDNGNGGSVLTGLALSTSSP